ERHPELYRAWMERPTEVSFPGGESYADMRERVQRAVLELRRQAAAAAAATAQARAIAIVAHGGTNRAILAEALRLADANIFRLGQAYACVNVIDYVGPGPVDGDGDDATPIVQLMNGGPEPNPRG